MKTVLMISQLLILTLDGMAAMSSAQDIVTLASRVSASGGGTVELADGTYHFYSSSATNMRFHASNHDQPDLRPVFLPFIGATNVAVVAKNAKFVMHGMGTAILVRDSLGVSFRGITIEWEKPFFAKAEIVGFEDGRTRVRFPPRDKVVVEDGKVLLCGEAGYAGGFMLDFLGRGGKWKARVFADGERGRVEYSEMTVTGGTWFPVNMDKSGGFALILTKAGAAAQ